MKVRFDDLYLEVEMDDEDLILEVEKVSDSVAAAFEKNGRLTVYSPYVGLWFDVKKKESK